MTHMALAALAVAALMSTEAYGGCSSTLHGPDCDVEEVDERDELPFNYIAPVWMSGCDCAASKPRLTGERAFLEARRDQCARAAEVHRLNFAMFDLIARRAKATRSIDLRLAALFNAASRMPGFLARNVERDYARLTRLLERDIKHEMEREERHAACLRDTEARLQALKK